MPQRAEIEELIAQLPHQQDLRGPAVHRPRLQQGKQRPPGVDDQDDRTLRLPVGQQRRDQAHARGGACLVLERIGQDRLPAAPGLFQQRPGACRQRLEPVAESGQDVALRVHQHHVLVAVLIDQAAEKLADGRARLRIPLHQPGDGAVVGEAGVVHEHDRIAQAFAAPAGQLVDLEAGHAGQVPAGLSARFLLFGVEQVMEAAGAQQQQ